jgi:hypothetical protein
MKEILNEFLNNVVCRREVNQYKAKKIWKTISINIPKETKQLFETEWEHYCLGQIDREVFISYFNSTFNNVK